jgi:hypothetical protein
MDTRRYGRPCGIDVLGRGLPADAKKRGQAIGKNTIPQNLCSINRQGKGSVLRLAGENITHLFGAKVQSALRRLSENPRAARYRLELLNAGQGEKSQWRQLAAFH